MIQYDYIKTRATSPSLRSHTYKINKAGRPIRQAGLQRDNGSNGRPALGVAELVTRRSCAASVGSGSYSRNGSQLCGHLRSQFLRPLLQLVVGRALQPELQMCRAWTPLFFSFAR